MRNFLTKKIGPVPVWVALGGLVLAAVVVAEMRSRRGPREARAPEPRTSHGMATTGGHETSFPVTGAIPGPAVVLVADTATPGQIKGGLGYPAPKNLLGSSGRARPAGAGTTPRRALASDADGLSPTRMRAANLVTAGRTSPPILAGGLKDRIATYAN